MHQISLVTYMSLLVQLIVRKLQFVKRYNVVHPVRTRCRGFGVYIQAGRRTGFLKALYPARVLVLVTIFVHWNKIH